jgi:hypothetical protein
MVMVPILNPINLEFGEEKVLSVGTGPGLLDPGHGPRRRTTARHWLAAQQKTVESRLIAGLDPMDMQTVVYPVFNCFCGEDPEGPGDIR